MITCLIVEDSRLARKELVSMVKSLDKFDEIYSAENAAEAIEILNEKNISVLFLDIHLPGKNGFELLESLDFAPQVIFTTAYDEYAIKSFEFNTVDYLLKPIKKDRLIQSIEKLNAEIEIDQKQLDIDQQVFVKDGDKCWFVKLKDIYLFESMGNYSKVYFENEKPLIQKSLNYLESVLDDSIFFRVNRQQIINLNYIDKVIPWFNGKLKIQLKSGVEIEVSRRQSQRVKNMFSL